MCKNQNGMQSIILNYFQEIFTLNIKHDLLKIKMNLELLHKLCPSQE